MVILLIGISSCGNESSSIDNRSSIIMDKSCSPPCWEKTTPGITTKQESKSILASIDWIDTNSIKDTSMVSPNDAIRWMAKPKSPDTSGRIFITNDLVTLIAIFPKDNALSFGDLVNKFGDPEKILIVSERPGKKLLTIYVLYPSKGYCFFYQNEVKIGDIVKTEIAPKLFANGVYYSESGKINSYLTSGRISNFDPNLIEKGIQNWHGFGEYNTINRD